MPDYSKAERQRIIDLLDALTGTKMSETEAGLLFLSELEWEGLIVLGERDTLEAARDARKECETQLALIRQAMETFGPAILAGHQEDGTWVRDSIGEHFAAALPHLKSIEAELERELDRHHGYLGRVVATSTNNAFVSRVKFKAADAWARRRGQVDYGLDFREFFAAVVKPVIGSLYSSDPVINFVSKYRSLRGLPPLR